MSFLDEHGHLDSVPLASPVIILTSDLLAEEIDQLIIQAVGKQGLVEASEFEIEVGGEVRSRVVHRPLVDRPFRVHLEQALRDDLMALLPSNVSQPVHAVPVRMVIAAAQFGVTIESVVPFLPFSEIEMEQIVRLNLENLQSPNELRTLHDTIGVSTLTYGNLDDLVVLFASAEFVQYRTVEVPGSADTKAGFFSLARRGARSINGDTSSPVVRLRASLFESLEGYKRELESREQVASWSGLRSARVELLDSRTASVSVKLFELPDLATPVYATELSLL
jgi:hypothetical protein